MSNYPDDCSAETHARAFEGEPCDYTADDRCEVCGAPKDMDCDDECDCPLCEWRRRSELTEAI